jgi:hypothetical protein
MGEVVHIDARRTVPTVLSSQQREALAVVQNWLNQTPDGDAFLTHHSMDTRKFDLVDLIVAYGERQARP